MPERRSLDLGHVPGQTCDEITPARSHEKIGWQTLQMGEDARAQAKKELLADPVGVVTHAERLSVKAIVLADGGRNGRKVVDAGEIHTRSLLEACRNLSRRDEILLRSW